MARPLPRPSSSPGVILTPLLLQGWNPWLATFWNTVAWTLSCEAAFYFAFPWLIRLRWPKTPGRLIALLLGIWAVGLVPHALYLLLQSRPPRRPRRPLLLRLLAAHAQVHAARLYLHLPRRNHPGQAAGILTLAAHHRAWIAGASLPPSPLFFATASTASPTS